MKRSVFNRTSTIANINLKVNFLKISMSEKREHPYYFNLFEMIMFEMDVSFLSNFITLVPIISDSDYFGFVYHRWLFWCLQYSEMLNMELCKQLSQILFLSNELRSLHRKCLKEVRLKSDKISELIKTNRKY